MPVKTSVRFSLSISTVKTLPGLIAFVEVSRSSWSGVQPSCSLATASSRSPTCAAGRGQFDAERARTLGENRPALDQVQPPRLRGRLYVDVEATAARRVEAV